MYEIVLVTFGGAAGAFLFALLRIASDAEAAAEKQRIEAASGRRLRLLRREE